MPEQRTAPEGEQWFSWTVGGEFYRQGSSHPWRSEEESGEVAAETVGEAVDKIVSGDDGISWDLFDGDREITITIKPREGGA